METIKFFFLFFLFLSACGVKGVPQAPLQPAQIGRGEPLYSTQAPNRAKVKNKYNYELEKGSGDAEDDED